MQTVSCDDLTFRGGGHLLTLNPMKNCLEVKALRNSKFEIRNSEKAKSGDRRWKMGGGKDMGCGILDMGNSRSPISDLRYPARRLLAWSVAVFLTIVSLAAAQEGGWKADLERMGSEVPIAELERGEIVGQKWIVGGSRPGFLGAKAFFIAPAKPKEVAQAVLEFDPTRGKELAWSAEGSVKLYEPFSRPPAPEDWSRFRSALGKPPFDILLQVEGRKA